jgi:hypothetical protein
MGLEEETYSTVFAPLKVLNQSTYYGQLHITFAELIDYNENEIPYSIVQGTLKIDTDPP